MFKFFEAYENSLAISLFGERPPHRGKRRAKTFKAFMKAYKKNYHLILKKFTTTNKVTWTLEVIFFPPNEENRRWRSGIKFFDFFGRPKMTKAFSYSMEDATDKVCEDVHKFLVEQRQALRLSRTLH
jgi:hypothetical protein